MSAAETLVSCESDDELRVRITDGKRTTETIEVITKEHTPAEARESTDRGMLIVRIDALSDLPGSLSHELEDVDDWDGVFEISARRSEDGTWTRPVLQAWGSGTESYTELGYVDSVKRI